MSLILLTIIAYLIVLFCIVLYFCRNQSLESYFVNKRSTSLLFMIFSNVATLIGAGAIVPSIGETYKGFTALAWANVSTLVLAVMLLGYIAPKIRKLGDKYNISTIVDYFQVRFDKKNRILMAIYQLMLLTVWIGLQSMAVTVLLSQILHIPYLEALLIVMAVCLLYSMVGGIKADIILDFVQFWVMLAIYLTMTIIACSHIDAIQIIKDTPTDVLNPSTFKGTSWFIVASLMLGFSYISSAPHWQKIISASSSSVARKSFFYATPIVLILTAIVMFLGIYAYHTLSGLDNSDKAVFVLMENTLPHWALGLGFAAIIATVTSSLDSMFVAGSTIIYKEFISNKNKSTIKARLITLAFGSFGVLITLVFPQMIDLGVFYIALAILPVTAIILSMTTKSFSSNASFYSILISIIALLALYPFAGAKTFLLTTPLSIFATLVFFFAEKIIAIKNKNTENNTKNRP